MNSATYIIGQLVLGGAEKQLYLLIKGLVSRGWKINVINLHGGHGDFWEGPIRELGVTVFEVTSTNRIKKFFQIFKFIKKNPTQIFHSWSTYTGLYAIFTSYLTKTKLTLTSQRSIENYIISDLGFFLYWVNYIAFKGISTNSYVGQNELARRFPKSIIRYIPNGIDISKKNVEYSCNDLREKFSIPKDLFVVGSIGTLFQTKRFDKLIDSVGLLQLDKINCGLVIIGDGPLFQMLIERAKRKLSPGTYFFLGSINSASDYLNLFDVFCLSSEFEGTPNVIMEALASGLPVVASDVGDVKTLIEHEATGLISFNNHPEEIANNIKRLFFDRNLRKKLSNAGKNKILAEYNSEFMVEKMINFYQEMERLNK